MGDVVLRTVAEPIRDSVVAPGGLVGAADRAMLQAERRGRGRLLTG